MHYNTLNSSELLIFEALSIIKVWNGNAYLKLQQAIEVVTITFDSDKHAYCSIIELSSSISAITLINSLFSGITFTFHLTILNTFDPICLLILIS